MLNRIILSGIIDDEPTFLPSGDLEVRLRINRPEIGKKEVISFFIRNERPLRKAISEIHKGYYLIMNSGRIITQNYMRTIPVICPHCQHTEYRQIQSERTEVECFDFSTMPYTEYVDSVGINKVFLMGNICSELNYRPLSNATKTKDYVKYKLAVDRNEVEVENNEEKSADFPFIVSFGKEATSAHEYLSKTNLILVEGAIQQREITQSNEFFCPNCGNMSKPQTKSIVREIITSRVDYLFKHSKQLAENYQLAQNL